MSETFSQTTPAGFALRLVGELYKSGRISVADEKTLRDVLLPIAAREHETSKTEA